MIQKSLLLNKLNLLGLNQKQIKNLVQILFMILTLIFFQLRIFYVIFISISLNFHLDEGHLR